MKLRRKHKLIIVLLIVIFIICLVLALIITNNKSAKAPSNPHQDNTSKQNKPNEKPKQNLKPKPPSYAYTSPTQDFKKRVTKKLFGTYVSPGNSPVSPERFSGYHTGADAEYGDIKGDVPVKAMAAGKVIAAQYVSGYGGVVAISSVINSAAHVVIYGHLDPGRLPIVGVNLKQGQHIGFLGVGYSQQTDGERRHLHLAILANNILNWRGYVDSKAELSGWLNPLTILNQKK